MKTSANWKIAVFGTPLLLLLSACNLAPKYSAPPAQTPVAFKEAPPQDYKEGAGWKIAQPGDDKIRAKWWELYNDRTLNALEEQVAISNQSIKQSEANFRAARALVVVARASLFPTISAAPSYSNSKSSSTTRGGYVIGGAGAGATTTTTGTTSTTGTSTGTSTGTTTGTTGSGTSTGTSSSTGGTSTVGTLSTSPVNYYSLSSDISYTVDLWHRVRNQIAADVYSAQASAADVATALLSTQAELAQDYFEVRALDAQRKILADTVANYQQSLKLTQTLFEAGIDSDEDVAQAQTQVDTTSAQLTDLGTSRATYEHAIAVLIGKPPSTFALEVAPFIPRPPEVPVAVPSELLERRPDIAAAERTVAAANASIGVARAAYYPNLTLNASGGFETTAFTEWFNWPSRFWSLGPSLSAPLFTGGARRGVREQAEAQYDADVANYRQTVLTAFQAVEDNLANLRILSREIDQERTAVRSANHYLDLSLTRFKAGVDSYLNVITAQNTVLTSRETELQIEVRQMSASVSLIMALGGGWSPQSPNEHQLLAKPASWKTPAEAGPAHPPATTANPPALPANLSVPGTPTEAPSEPGSSTPVGVSPPPVS